MVEHRMLGRRQMRTMQLPTGSWARFRTALDESSLRKLPDGLGFHGTKASELRFFEKGDGVFSGHGVFLRPATIYGFENVFGRTGRLSICFNTACGFSSVAFSESGYQRLDKCDYPLILIAKNQSPPYFTAARDDLVSIVLPSEKEMRPTIQRARKFVNSGPEWHLAVMWAFTDSLMSLLVKKTLVALEKLAR